MQAQITFSGKGLFNKAIIDRYQIDCKRDVDKLEDLWQIQIDQGRPQIEIIPVKED